MIRFHSSELNSARQDLIYTIVPDFFVGRPNQDGSTSQGSPNFSLLFAGFAFARI